MKSIKWIAAVFTLLMVLNSCQKEYSVENGGSSGGNATGSLQMAATGECMPSTVIGTYRAGTLLDASNYVVISVNITSLGAYNIVSNIVNGYSFSASGVATATGVQTIRLNASGTPTTSGANTFTIIFGSSQCNLVVDALAAGGGAGLNTWSFKVGTTTYSGTTNPATLTATPASISITGTNAASGNFSISLTNLAGPMGTGIYPGNTTIPGRATVTFAYQQGAAINYLFVPFTAGNISTTVSTYNTTTKNIVASFSGTAKSAGGTGPDITVTEGTFNATWP